MGRTVPAAASAHSPVTAARPWRRRRRSRSRAPAGAAAEPPAALGAVRLGARRGDSPAARCAATIAPAEVPTKYSHPRVSIRSRPRCPPSTPSSRPRRARRRRRAPARRARKGIPARLAATGRARRSIASAVAEAYVITYARMATVDELRPPRARARAIRALREAMDLSLRDLAERCGVSAPMLSQVERGETSPTLQVAARIAAGLDLRLSQLLRLDEDGAVTVVRRRRAAPGPVRAARPQLRDPDAAAARPARRAVAPRAGARRASPAAPATRRCTSPAAARRRSSRPGRSCCTATAQPHELAAGDCVTFDADLPHHFENPGDEEAVLLAVVSAGLRRS